MKPISLTRFVSGQRVVNLKYSEIGSNLSISDKLYEAFGKEGQGLLTVSEIPRLVSVRQNFFKQSFKLEKLSESEKSKLLNPWSGYRMGWSEDKSPFGEIRASFTANPVEDTNTHLPYSNLWPAQLPYFRSQFRDLGQILIKTSADLSLHIDHFLDMHFPYSLLPRFETAINSSSNHLATLTYSLPFSKKTQKPPEKIWETNANIFSIFVSPIYHNRIENSTEESENVVIVKKDGEEVLVSIGSDSVCFVIGKMSEELSEGIFECRPYAEIHEEKFRGFVRTAFSVNLVKAEGDLLSNQERGSLGKSFAGFI